MFVFKTGLPIRFKFVICIQILVSICNYKVVSILGVTDCVRPGVATFFIITRLSVYWGDHMSVRMLSVVGIGELDKWRKRTAPRPGNREERDKQVQIQTRH